MIGIDVLIKYLYWRSNKNFTKEDIYVLYDDIDSLLNEVIITDARGDDQPLSKIVPFVSSFEIKYSEVK